jgi:hypothetical protein
MSHLQLQPQHHTGPAVDAQQLRLRRKVDVAAAHAQQVATGLDGLPAAACDKQQGGTQGTFQAQQLNQVSINMQTRTQQTWLGYSSRKYLLLLDWPPVKRSTGKYMSQSSPTLLCKLCLSATHHADTWLLLTTDTLYLSLLTLLCLWRVLHTVRCWHLSLAVALAPPA